MPVKKRASDCNINMRKSHRAIGIEISQIYSGNVFYGYQVLSLGDPKA